MRVRISFLSYRLYFYEGREPRHIANFWRKKHVKISKRWGGVQREKWWKLRDKQQTNRRHFSLQNQRPSQLWAPISRVKKFSQICGWACSIGKNLIWNMYQEEKILSSDLNHAQEITNFPQQPYFACHGITMHRAFLKRKTNAVEKFFTLYCKQQYPVYGWLSWILYFFAEIHFRFFNDGFSKSLFNSSCGLTS